MKVIPLLAIAASTLALAGCVRPYGYAGGAVYREQIYVESDRGYRGYRDRDAYYEARRYDRPRYDRPRDDGWRRGRDRDRDWDDDRRPRRRDDDRY